MFGTEIFGEKNFWSENCWSEVFRAWKIWCLENLVSEKFCVQKNFSVQNIIGSPKSFGSTSRHIPDPSWHPADTLQTPSTLLLETILTLFNNGQLCRQIIDSNIEVLKLDCCSGRVGTCRKYRGSIFQTWACQILSWRWSRVWQ